MIVMGVDPGLATGLAIWNTKTQLIEYMEEAQNGVLGVSVLLPQLVKRWKPKIIVWETFQLRSGNDFLADLSGVESLGWAKGTGYYGAGTAPATHKTFNKLGKNDPKPLSPMTKLMKAQGWAIGKGHNRDALSVAIHHACVRLKDVPTMETHKRLLKGK